MVQGRLSRARVIFADDLTGANDTGVQFARIGLRTQVCFGALQESVLDSSDIVVVDTDSRACGAECAYQRVQRAAAFFAAHGAPILYKKMDSTLRGEIGAELDAVMDVYDVKLAVVSPAFPANRRTLLGGILLLNGVPVAQSPFASDPQTPVRESNLPALLSVQSRRTIHPVSLDEIAAGPHRLSQRFSELQSPGGAIAVCDAVTDAHLSVIVDAAMMIGDGCLLAGSAGLARPLALRINDQMHDAQTARVLIINGSLHPLMREQIRELVREQSAYVISVDPTAAADEESWRHWLEHTLLRLENIPALAPIVLTVPTNLLEGKQASPLLPRLGELAGAALARLRVFGVVVSGGATLHELCARWGTSGLELVDEVAPGIPSCIIRGGQHDGLLLVTKAGGFGDADALVEIVRHFARRVEPLSL